ncbi:DUF1987 domain-containing protein [Thiomicrospira microaerophila]|uniref:DUF1987 domain-containing protein n=1 Tax=Thiomicrospira microaerophila TaxID=406020 RepID=UPI0005C982B2|nr:DUF1987 domain-containing protein [Thiomicrospira microaerophila]
MQDLVIEQTQYTPAISMLTEGKISLIGKSYPENTFEFYKPVIQWLNSFFEEGSVDSLSVTFEIIYFNSSSSKVFFDFFDVLNLNKEDKNIHVIWQHDVDNESALEAGEDFVDDFPDLNITIKTTD